MKQTDLEFISHLLSELEKVSPKNLVFDVHGLGTAYSCFVRVHLDSSESSSNFSLGSLFFKAIDYDYTVECDSKGLPYIDILSPNYDLPF